ncbi:MAG: redoxin family protein [Chitinophagaceae bacterium]|nr:redoxin family protein [Chitinophagaceae bacterium]
MRYLLLFCITVALAACFAGEAEPQKTGKEGKPLPNFVVQLPDSISFLNTQKLQDNTPLAVFYFSPACPHCRAQVTEMIDDMDRLKDIQLLFITAYPYNHMKRFYEQYDLKKYPNIIIGSDTANFISSYFGITGVPYTAIYDKHKRLTKAFLGKIYSSQIINAAGL